jgi:hypothetical protein
MPRGRLTRNRKTGEGWSWIRRGSEYSKDGQREKEREVGGGGRETQGTGRRCSVARVVEAGSSLHDTRLSTRAQEILYPIELTCPDGDGRFCMAFANSNIYDKWSVFVFSQSFLMMGGYFDENLWPAYYEDGEMGYRSVLIDSRW